MVCQKWIWNEKDISTWSFLLNPFSAKEFWRLEVEDKQFQQNPLSLAQRTARVSFTEVCRTNIESHSPSTVYTDR